MHQGIKGVYRVQMNWGAWGMLMYAVEVFRYRSDRKCGCVGALRCTTAKRQRRGR